MINLLNKSARVIAAILSAGIISNNALADERATTKTLVETDGDVAQHIPANWSPSFVTNKDASDMTLTFYNVKPLQGLLGQYAINAYGKAPPHINEMFVVRISDAATARVDKSWIVFPFSGTAYVLGGNFNDRNTAQIDGLLDLYAGRKVSYNTNNHRNVSRWAFFTPEQDVNSFEHDGPALNGSRIGFLSCCGNNFNFNITENGYFPFAGSTTLGYGAMPRMYQSQDPNFTLTMRLGAIPASKRVQVDSYITFSRSDDPTVTKAPYATCLDGPRNCQNSLTRVRGATWRYNSTAHPVDFRYVFTSTEGLASKYSIPTSKKAIAVDSSAELVVSDAPDNPYQQCAGGVIAGSGKVNFKDSSYDCADSSFKVSALYVGVQNSLQQSVGMAGATTPGSCGITYYCVSNQLDYSVNGAHWVVTYLNEDPR